MAGVQSCEFGRLPDGRVVHAYTLDNGQGLRLTALTLGGIVSSLWVPDPQGHTANVVLGFDNLNDYAVRNPHFGVIVGRYGNRIAQGRFTLDGQAHQLDCNDGLNSLHGGSQGFGKQLWQAEVVAPRTDESAALLLHYTSADGEQGYPGCLQVRVRYSLGVGPSWRIDYEAQSDSATVINLTHHDYFNLAGQGSALDHLLSIPATRYTEVDDGLIPLGHAAVEGTPFDFRQPRVIGERIRQPHPQLLLGKGYDHNWVLDHPQDGALHLAARLQDPVSGRCMEVHSTEPAVQFYSGNFLDGSLPGGNGQTYRQGDGLCLETQHNPDSPNHPASADWPTTVLRPGEIYTSSTVHRFSNTL